MKLRLLIGCILSLVMLQGARAGGGYQRTKDGKTYIWNNRPQPEDAASWSGKRDAEGYANGYGTLTWYRVDKKIVTGSNVPAKTEVALTRYTGTMVHGKLEGPVSNADANGRMYHGTFADGHKTSDWHLGAATAVSEAKGPSQTEPKSAAAMETSKPSAPAAEIAAPAEEPEPIDNSTVKETPAKVEPVKPAQAKGQYDDSLRSLVGPPADLHKSNPGVAAPAVTPPPAAIAPTGEKESAAERSRLDIKMGVSPSPGLTVAPHL
jgi:hypothetical protein